MGIINITPDSFYPGSRSNSIDDILKTTDEMIINGASIIDVGGQSTRPGSRRIEADEELKKVIPAIEEILKRFPEVIISVDTFYSRVAEHAIHAGAALINDVSAGTIDEDLITTIAKLNVPYVLMHMKGNPENMQQHASYKNVVLEVFDFLNFTIKKLTDLGIQDIIVDPGFGFAKTIEHNFKLLANLSYLSQLNKPIMVGLSRKSTVYKTLGIPADEALNGTTVLHTISLLNGANILRVHDVTEAMQAIKLITIYKNEKEQF
jgi:dihydropteroate synthase